LSSTPIDPLTRLAIKHGTDKWGQHFYTPIYHRLFEPFRKRAVRVLEIGVGGYRYRTIGGASLAMWAEYFPQGRIVGIDIAPKALDLDPRITLLQGSQADASFLAGVASEHGPFDLVIDDGSHVPKDIIVAFDVLFPSLADGGLYVIEDTQTAFWPDFGGEPGGGELYRWAHAIMLGLNHVEIAVSEPEQQPTAASLAIRSFRVWHNLFVIEKGDNTEPSNKRYDSANDHARRAIATIERALKRKPTAAGLAELAEVRRASGDLTAAAAVIDAALATWPDSIGLLVVGSRIALKMGLPERARRLLLHALKIDPADSRLAADLASVIG
jgi:demethylmacrocin O-methyltransferase